MNSNGFHLAFACSWWRPKETTWSYTPMSLRQAFAEADITVHDVEAQPPFILQAALATTLTSAGYRPWKYARHYRTLEAYRVRSAVKRIKPHAVLELGELTVPTSSPTYAYQDTNFSVAVEHYERLGRDMVSTIPCALSTLRRLADEQKEALQKLDGVLALGQWYREHLIHAGVLPAHRVHAVGGGISPYYVNLPPRIIRPAGERTRILFVGGEFRRKGGDFVLEAMRRLNTGGDRKLRLTIVGPPVWPLSGRPPEWVDYLGVRSRAETAQLFASHDLFVMPSRFEAYGVVFLEARAAGIPCVGRNAFAMPELIQPGIGGAVWGGDDIDDLATLINVTLNDDGVHERCASNARQFALENTWARVAQRTMASINGPQLRAKI
jgi:glycosyltransferase involved in cell wall biosynthesis